MNDEIQMVPIDRIRILNPRHRDRRKFATIVESIKVVGLKKPIQVSLRTADEGTEPGYDLVCGQGRIEAFLALGYREIPAIVVELKKEDRLLRSIIENMARRQTTPLELMREIDRLKGRGHSNVEIGQKLGISHATVGGLIALNTAGEERLIEAAITGKIPLGVAMDIAKTVNVQTQRELLKAYESRDLNQASIREVKRLIEQRRFFGKLRRSPQPGPRKGPASAESLVNTYKRERQRQKLLIRKAKLCDAKFVFIVSAFNTLFGNEAFVNLLRAEALDTLPKVLWTKVNPNRKATHE